MKALLISALILTALPSLANAACSAQQIDEGLAAQLPAGCTASKARKSIIWNYFYVYIKCEGNVMDLPPRDTVKYNADTCIRIED